MLPQWTDKNLRQLLEIDNLMIMYVGNLEPYQGIDLLLDSFALVLEKSDQASLVIIGGDPADIQAYRHKCEQLGITHNVHWVGPKPVEELPLYLSQADILVSPRIKGVNTPMKLYSYLGSGKATLVTQLPTHTQLVNQDVAMLAAPEPVDFAEAMVQLMQDAVLRQKLGAAGKALIEENYSHKAFCNRLNGLLDWLEGEMGLRPDLPLPGAQMS
jgi:glycosyltransferase involved in cell wall biosynthesis